MADFFTYENSNQSQVTENVYTEKQWRWFQDTNNGNYNSQVTFDLTGLSNSEGFTNGREMRLDLPMIGVISQNNAAGIPAAGLADCFAMKNGYYNLIDSMNFTYDGGTTIQQICSNQNFYISFDKITKMSKCDLDTIAPTLGFYPDSADSWDYKTAGDATGYGLTNNDSVQTIATSSYTAPGAFAANAVYPITSTFDPIYNKGFVERNSYINKSATTAKIAAFKDVGTLDAEFYPNTKLRSAGNANDYQAFYFIATIRLRDISSFFDKCSLVKSFYARLTFNINTGSVILARTANTGELTAIQTNFRYNTCPFMISSTLSSKLANATTQVVVGIHLQKVLSTPGATVDQAGLGISAHPLPSCRIYAPIIKLDPDRAIEYLKSNVAKYIEYEEIMSIPYPNVGTGAMFSINVSNSIVNPVGILVIPMLSSTANNGAGAAYGFTPSQSPFASEPATTSPLISLTQFNVVVAGKNVFTEPILYNWEMFTNELSIHNGINGNQTDGLCSGLLSYREFLNNYRYYYVDLSRRLGESNVSQSIVITGKNSSRVTIDLYIFVIRKKALTLNAETGRIIGEIVA